MDKEQAIKKAQAYVETIRELVDFQEVYLFGSYAHGTPREESDVDLAVFVDSISRDYFDTLKDLFKARKKIDTLIEPHLFLTGRDESGFQDEVKRTGMRIC